MVRSASRIISTSPVAAAKPLRTASPLPLPSCFSTLMSQLILVGVADAFAFRERAVAGIAFDEDDFLVRSKFRHAPDRIFDVAALVAAGNDDARREFAIRERDHRAGDDIGAQAQLPDARQRRDVFVDQRSEAEQASWHQLPLLLADHLEIGEVHQIEEVDGGDVVDLGLLALQPRELAELEDRFPQMRVIGDNDPGGRRTKPVDQPESFVDVLEHPDGVGDHDVVEGPLDRRKGRLILDVALHEVELRVAL